MIQGVNGAPKVPPGMALGTSPNPHARTLPSTDEQPLRRPTLFHLLSSASASATTNAPSSFALL